MSPSSTEKGRGAHTAGPWEVTRTNLSWYVVPQGGHMGNAIASGILPAHTFPMTREEKDATGYMADARLIAAAPDLFESERQNLSVLENLLAYLRKHEAVLPPFSTASLDVRIEATRAAIRRATGESSK